MAGTAAIEATRSRPAESANQQAEPDIHPETHLANPERRRGSRANADAAASGGAALPLDAASSGDSDAFPAPLIEACVCSWPVVWSMAMVITGTLPRQHGSGDLSLEISMARFEGPAGFRSGT